MLACADAARTEPTEAHVSITAISPPHLALLVRTGALEPVKPGLTSLKTALSGNSAYGTTQTRPRGMIGYIGNGDLSKSTLTGAAALVTITHLINDGDTGTVEVPVAACAAPRVDTARLPRGKRANSHLKEFCPSSKEGARTVRKKNGQVTASTVRIQVALEEGEVAKKRSRAERKRYSAETPDKARQSRKAAPRLGRACLRPEVGSRT
ncbi:hypothetical protein C8R43DRAFT_943405 [Mycena crocata]|nr:hypothetical protein C8R43DRAFT_943405 [Mycena crocata]